MKLSFISWFTQYSALKYLDELTYGLHFGPQMAELALRFNVRILDFEISDQGLSLVVLGYTKTTKSFKREFEQFVIEFLSEFYPKIANNPFTANSTIEELSNQVYAELLNLHYLSDKRLKFPSLKRGPSPSEQQLA